MLINKISGGRTEIRTQERVAPLPVFKTGAFNHSANFPCVTQEDNSPSRLSGRHNTRMKHTVKLSPSLVTERLL